MSIMKKIFLILFPFLILSYSIKAQQNPVDSLQSILETSQIDTVKINVLIELSNLLRSRDIEQATQYSAEALKLAEEINYKNGIAEANKVSGVINFMAGEIESAFELTNSAKDIFVQIEDYAGIAACYVNLGIFYRQIGEIEESGNSFQKAIENYKIVKDNEGVAKTYLNIGNLFRQQGNMIMALENYLNSLKFFEEEKNENMTAMLYQNIGIVYSEQKDSLKALTNFNKALEVFERIEDKQGMALVYNNLGNVYEGLGNFDSAIEYYSKSLNLFQAIDYLPMVALNYYNLGGLYLRKMNTDKAKEYFDLSLELYETMNYPPGIANCYNGLGSYYFYLKDYKQSIEYLEKAKEIARETELSTLTQSVEYLSKSYAEAGQFKKAYENHVLFKKYNDSIFNENNEKTITALSMQYEFDKKEKIRELEIQKEKQIREAKQKEKDKWDLIVKSGLTALVLLMLVIAMISIVNYRRKVKANKLLKSQKEEISFQKVELEQRNEEIEAQKDEIEKINVFVTQQRDIAIKQKQEITDSIQYAQRIQEAVLPDISEFEQYIDDFFIYFKPKDIVSGDFYWMTKAEEKLIIVAADCTGHGVPGAFMSLLGLTFLNEIVNKDGILQANEILNRLRFKVIESLHQKNRETKDGMDIAISIINPGKQEIQFAGAYNPLYFIPADHAGKPVITKIAADRMPIGIHLKMDTDFKNNIIPYKKGDTVYMFSDGYSDQFGGTDGRKLKSKKFQEILIKIQDKNMTEQKEFLDTFLNEWKGDLDQLDDIIIVGIKL
jgi:serine phosphatase RsbU (regulator of sigma subunit)